MKTLLLAEHHGPTLEHLEALLSQAGFSVRGVTEPGPALEHFVADRPDGVLVAVDFPRLEGAHLGKLIRANDFGRRIPLVAIDKGHLGRARGVGTILDLRADAYVADPLKGKEWVERVRQLLEAAEDSGTATTHGIQATLSRSPVAAGDLRGLPLPALLHASYRLQRDGVLVLASRDLTRRVFLLEGAPCHYDSTARQDSLPSYLVERSELGASEAETVVRLLASGKPIRTALFQAGLSAQGEELLQKLRDYVREKVAQVVGMREGRYALYAGREFAEEVPAIDTPALAPLLEGARRTFPVKIFAQALKPHLGAFPARSPQFARDLPALGLNTQDLKVAMQMNGRIQLKELVAHGRGDLRLSYSLFWFLHLTQDVAFAPAPQGAGASQVQAEPDRISPRKKKALPAGTVSRLREDAVKIVTGSYFRVLGLDISADTEAVERAYHRIATAFHPDTYAEFDTSPIQDLLESVQDKLSASYRVLSVEEKRKAYVQYLLSRLDVRAAAVNVDAEIALKRGEAALRRKDAQGALRAFEEAVELNPKEPEYYSYLAWATYQAGRGDREERARAAQRLLKKALGMNPYLERAMIISAIIDGELGQREAARRKLCKVLALNPASQLAKASLRKVSR